MGIRYEFEMDCGKKFEIEQMPGTKDLAITVFDDSEKGFACGFLSGAKKIRQLANLLETMARTAETKCDELRMGTL